MIKIRINSKVVIAKLTLFLHKGLHRWLSITQQLQQIFIHMLNIKASKCDLPSPAAVSVNSKPPTHGAHVSLSLSDMPLCRPCSLLVWNCEISHEFLSFSRFLYQLHLSAGKLLQGWISAAASLVLESAAWHWAFLADIGEDCLSWSPQCWNPRKSCLFLQQWMDKSRAHLTTTTHTRGTAQDKQSIKSRCNKNFWQWLIKFDSFYSEGGCVKMWKLIIDCQHFHLYTSIHWLILFVVIVSYHIINQI